MARVSASVYTSHVPAIGAALARPGKHVNAIVGDGAFAMTCMEIATAVAHGLGICYFVFHDGALSQIAQAQEIPYNRTPCSELPPLRLEGIAVATGAHYLRLGTNEALERTIDEAHRVRQRPVLQPRAQPFGKFGQQIGRAHV